MKIISRIYIWIFFLLLIVPAAAMPYFKDAVNTEKRELSELPAIYSDGEFNNRFSVEMNTWIQEHIGFRGPMIALNNRLRTGLFGQGATDDIVVGKEDWLFYYESVDDYLHVPTITPRNAANAAHTAAMFETYAREQGGAFLLAFLPNKNTVYGEYNKLKQEFSSKFKEMIDKQDYSLLLKIINDKTLSKEVCDFFGFNKSDIYIKRLIAFLRLEDENTLSDLFRESIPSKLLDCRSQP